MKQTLLECWASQAALAIEFNLKKHNLREKTFGIYSATDIDTTSPLMAGLTTKNQLKMPQSRRTNIDQPHGVKIVASNDEIGPMILHASQINQTYLTGHPEYDVDTLKIEYERDLNKKNAILAPKNYFDRDHHIHNTWQSSSHQVYQNWLNLMN